MEAPAVGFRNTWWTILDAAIKLQESVTWYISKNVDYINKSNQITIQDWLYLRIIYIFLSAFKLATLKLKGLYSTLEKVLYIISVLDTIIK